MQKDVDVHRRRQTVTSGCVRLSRRRLAALQLGFSADDPNAVTSPKSPTQRGKELTEHPKHTYTQESKCVEKDDPKYSYNDIKKHRKSCYLDAKPKYHNPLHIIPHLKNSLDPKLIVKTTFVRSEDPHAVAAPNPDCLSYQLSKRIRNLNKKTLQETVLRSMEGNVSPSSTDEEPNERPSKSAPGERAGCSYIEQYSHVPETSAFQRYARAPLPPLGPPHGTSKKEHNSEQYGRDFTTYDGITARNRRHSTSVPSRGRDDTPKQTADRMQKIRHKLNPVRDYRLMDTVHYLAQGEFAPRDDGIKLTPSREAVLSDIIWEDVCRTHWPNARLNRRIAAHPERSCSNRRGSGELQRLIDNLLRERVAHVERRRRRHYRIVKLNNRHENSKSMGKTGDIIVASHKRSRDLASSDHRATPVLAEGQWADHSSSRRSHKSHDRLVSNKHWRSNRSDECSPGPSYAVNRVAETRQENHFYRSPRVDRSDRGASRSPNTMCCSSAREATSGSSASNSFNKNSKSMRHGIRKDMARRKHQREEPNLEHFILLPTLVVRTPSNVRRQKKFNELYHRILHVHYQNKCDDGASGVGSEAAERRQVKSCEKRDIGLNIHITLSDSEKDCKKS